MSMTRDLRRTQSLAVTNDDFVQWPMIWNFVSGIHPTSQHLDNILEEKHVESVICNSGVSP